MTELKTRKTKHNSLIQDSDIFWFIDDLTALIDGGEFEKVHYGNYPPEFELKRQSSSENKISLLDLGLKNCQQKFFIKAFDKRDWFPISIMKMTYLFVIHPQKKILRFTWSWNS